MILYGSILDTPKPETLRYYQEGAVVICDTTGTILYAGEKNEKLDSFSSHQSISFPNYSRPVIIPGLIDSHAHLPQYPAVARKEESLLPWLEKHIFPLEEKFTGKEHRRFIEAFFDEVIQQGTTTIVLYGAIWEDTTDLAFEIAEEKGIRIIMGKVMMDVGSYGEKQTTLARSISIVQTHRLIEKWHGKDNHRIEYAISPRFAVTCSMDLMKESAELASSYDTFIQTHISENHGEIEAVKNLFPQCNSYADIYASADLLTPKTILGHGVHLTDPELDLIKHSDARIAHCPTSNLFLNSGLYPLDKINNNNILTALASDIAGGPELNMWQVMRSAIEIQKARCFQQGLEPSIPELSPTQAFYLATQGAAQVLHKEKTIGSLKVGKEADITVVDLNKTLPLNGEFTAESFEAEQVLTALIYRGNQSSTLASYVRGNKIG